MPDVMAFLCMLSLGWVLLPGAQLIFQYSIACSGDGWSFRML